MEGRGGREETGQAPAKCLLPKNDIAVCHTLRPMSGKKADVYFGSVQHGARARFASFARKVDVILERLDFSTIDRGDKVAVKMHLGFREGYQTVPVFFVRRVVQAVRKAGGVPFITDNPTSVYNAVERGYTSETCGCPLIPVAGVKDRYTYTTEFGFLNVESMEMGGVLHDADVLVDLTHVKGHNSCGFGGAIKNIALGGYQAHSRWNKIHRVGQAFDYWDGDKCTPEHAKELVEVCPQNCISYDEKEHKLTVSFDMCNQCMECVKADRDVGCIQIRPESFSAFQELMALSAKKVLDTFNDDKRFFISFLIDITAYCDCWGFGQPPVVRDIGVLGSRDIVAIEQASLDLIAKAGLMTEMIPPFMKNVDLDPSADLHPFARLHGPMKDPYIVVRAAERLGMGSSSYELVEVLSPEETMKMKAPERVRETEPSFY